MHNFDLILNYFPHSKFWGGGRVPPSPQGIRLCSHELSITVDEVVSTGKKVNGSIWKGILDSDSVNSTNMIYEYIQLNRNQHTRKHGRI